MAYKIWWMFILPGSIAYVPAETEAAALENMRRNSFLGAPVETWNAHLYFLGKRETLFKDASDAFCWREYGSN